MQMHMQHASAATSGETAVDLVSYVEFQRNYRVLTGSHRAALLATRSFWQLMLRAEVGGALALYV